jgi:hypothetical protein
MFNSAQWDCYLTEYRVNARMAGADTLDIIDLLWLAIQRELPRARAESAGKDILIKHLKGDSL